MTLQKAISTGRWCVYVRKSANLDSAGVNCIMLWCLQDLWDMSLNYYAEEKISIIPNEGLLVVRASVYASNHGNTHLSLFTVAMQSILNITDTVDGLFSVLLSLYLWSQFLWLHRTIMLPPPSKWFVFKSAHT